ncbi:MAG: hypothetical protein AB7V50_02670 [Vampirovibrionia bacterium]
MKKLLLFALILITFNTTIQDKATANQLDTENIASIETELFNQTYNNVAINDRLNRIEKMIYGKSFDKSNINERLNNLTPFIPKNNNINKTSKEIIQDNTTYTKTLPSFDKVNFNNDRENEDTNYLQGSLPPRRDVIFTEEPQNTGYYPNIDQAEQLLLGQIYSSDDIYNRLDRLEKQIHITNKSDSLDNRMQQIDKQIKLISLKDKYSYNNRNNVQPDINIMPEPINNHHYNKNFSNGIQDQYITPMNYSNNNPENYTPINNMYNQYPNQNYIHQASYQSFTPDVNNYVNMPAYAAQPIAQTAVNTLVQNTVNKKPGLWQKINHIGQMTRNALLGGYNPDDYYYNNQNY